LTLARRDLAIILTAFLFIVALEFISPASPALAQQLDPSLFGSLHWREIGPFRGGRTRALSGVPSQPNVFYIGVVNGGVWKTTDAGRTWTPLFNEQPTGSIGAIAVSLSDPNIIYVGSGEGLHRPDLSVGDGIYKSNDGGRNWTHLGLRDGQQIPQIAVDPRDANRVLVAIAGHPYGPNPERGIFRSTDGGQSFQKVLYKDENTGGDDVLYDPSDPSVAYASLWEAREGPWENGSWNGPGGGIFKSTDGGQNWQQLSNGLPAGMVQAHLAIAPSHPQRLYASVATKDAVKLYRTGDGGRSWIVASEDPRATGRIGGGDLPVPAVDPKNPDIIYVTSTVTWKSTDAGKTWVGFRGAPGGDDYQSIWINSNDPKIIALASDQGAIVSINGGESWSSWYNQPTAQLYHANADNAFPYRVCGGQQESGSVCISSRGNDGEITMREWHPVAAEEYGYVVPDPLDPDIIYGGKLTRFDRRTGQAQDILPKVFRSPDFRVLRTEPIVFSPQDPHILYFAANTLWKTSDGGKSWRQASPDLTRQTFALPATVGKYAGEATAKPRQRGVIYTVAPSPVDSQRIWVGTDDGLIHLTTDGGAHWGNITPASLAPFQKVSLIAASHFDAATAYAAINTLRLDDLRPHILRTRDSGKTWSEITNGIPNNENVNSVREDTRRKGLLFAGTEHAVYVSFDDGDHWQSLRLNMPATSVREVIVKNDDLVAATHGRGFWILDNITPLRQAEAGNFTGEAFLFHPQTAVRVRWNTNPDTPLPPDEPAGENPPDGAVIDYFLKSASAGPVTLQIQDSAGNIVRRYSSADPVEPADPMLEIPTYWVRPPQTLSPGAGMHRFVWDLHYSPLRGIKPEYPIAAVYRNTAPEPTSPWALPGQYTVTLTVNGKSYQQPLTVSMDPRVRIASADLAQQLKVSQPIYEELASTSAAMEQMKSVRAQLKNRRQQSPSLAGAIDALDQKIKMLQGAETARPTPGVEPPPTFTILQGKLTALFRVLQGVDAAPTTQALATGSELQQMQTSLMESWKQIMSQDIGNLNQQLQSSNLPPISAEGLDAR
jgi:photosystem II stability/assembly factor-like uncharacterized protein